MSELILQDLDDDLLDRLRARAAENGRSVDEEVRVILRAAVLGMNVQTPKKLGTLLVDRFRGLALDGEVEELRGQPAHPADLNP